MKTTETEGSDEKRAETKRKIFRDRTVRPRFGQETQKHQAGRERRMGLEKHMKPAVRVFGVNPRIDQRGARHRLALGGGDRFEPFEKAEEAATVLEASKRRVAFGIGGESKTEIGPEGLFEAVESPTVVTLSERDPPEGEVRPKTTRIVCDRFVVETGRLVAVSEPPSALSGFTAVMRQDGVEGFGAFARQADRRGVGLVPGALVFVDREKTSQGANTVGGILSDILEKRLRPVVETRRKVVAGQLIESADVEGTREDIKMVSVELRLIISGPSCSP